ncbi:MAG TPA: Rieske 2Fe-2S domain-containing protein [Jatrophihabitans sp.]|jgi:Rieske Fe-S protein|uniref:QcrA and Rieske domain-containing protein n=1 Tax=Jatrophihabitans sp. TaxID=1932789 RepID=UPI002EE6845A
MSTEHEDDRSTVSGISRRSLLAAGAIGIPAVALVACSKAPAEEPTPTSSSSPVQGLPTTPASGAPLAKLSDITVGEAIAATGPDGGDIIIVRTAATTVEAYSAICTHEGCTVKPAGKELDCPCHGSVFDLKGAVLNGPAQRPLKAVKVALSGDNVVAG